MVAPERTQARNLSVGCLIPAVRSDFDVSACMRVCPGEAVQGVLYVGVERGIHVARQCDAFHELRRCSEYLYRRRWSDVIEAV
jgi:hypothetical protein